MSVVPINFNRDRLGGSSSSPLARQRARQPQEFRPTGPQAPGAGGGGSGGYGTGPLPSDIPPMRLNPPEGNFRMPGGGLFGDTGLRGSPYRPPPVLAPPSPRVRDGLIGDPGPISDMRTMQGGGDLGTGVILRPTGGGGQWSNGPFTPRANGGPVGAGGPSGGMFPGANPADIAAFWTPERMAGAVAPDMGAYGPLRQADLFGTGAMPSAPIPAMANDIGRREAMDRQMLLQQLLGGVR